MRRPKLLQDSIKVAFNAEQLTQSYTIGSRMVQADLYIVLTL